MQSLTYTLVQSAVYCGSGGARIGLRFHVTSHVQWARLEKHNSYSQMNWACQFFKTDKDHLLHQAFAMELSGWL